MVLNVQFRWYTAAVEIKCESRLHLTMGLVVTYDISHYLECGLYVIMVDLECEVQCDL